MNEKRGNEHFNKSSGMPKQSFDTFDETWAYIIKKRLHGVFPYQCSLCGKFHYGHPEKPEEAESYTKIIKSYGRKLWEIKEELSATRNKLSQVTEKFDRELKEIRESSKTLMEELQRAKKDNKYLMGIVENTKSIDTTEVLECLQGTDPCQYYRKRIPKTLAGARFRVIGNKKTGFRAQYYWKDSGLIEVTTPFLESQESAYGYMYKKLQEAKIIS